MKIRVCELFAGVGGFRIGLSRSSDEYEFVYSNQWEPSTKRQDASIIYCKRFGSEGHSNQDIATVKTDEIPEHDLMVAGFPCQDYSVATTLKNSGGIYGKKGVLWWQIYRILDEMANKPKYLFFENVDRLLSSPAQQRGRDFAIILASLNDLGYTVEWKVINAADYGMPQRRRRTYILGYLDNNIGQDNEPLDWITETGVMVKAFSSVLDTKKVRSFDIDGDLSQVSDNFNKGQKQSPFYNTGISIKRHVTTCNTTPVYDGKKITLGDLMVDESEVPEEFFISDEELPKWQYLKGSKKMTRIDKKTGFEYTYSEGGMAFPDSTSLPSRTIITGEGGKAPSRFKHVVLTESGRYRRLLPIELERLNMFPDNHTQGASDTRRAFLMGNAMVVGVVEKIGLSLINFINKNLQYESFKLV